MSSNHFINSSFNDFEVFYVIFRKKVIKSSFLTGVNRSRNGHCLGPGPLGHGWDPSYTSPSHPKGFWPRATNGQDMGIFQIFALISKKIENMNK